MAPCVQYSLFRHDDLLEMRGSRNSQNQENGKIYFTPSQNEVCSETGIMTSTVNERQLANDDFSISRDEDGREPPALPRRRRQRRKRVKSANKKETVDKGIGEVLPSDMAFVDVVLEKRDLNSSFYLDLFDVKSNRRARSTDDGNLLITYTHRVTYRDEAIYEIETTTFCNGRVMWGQTSSCGLSNGQLKIKIRTKAKNSRFSDIGMNARENMVFSLEELAKLASKARENEMRENI